MYPVVNSLFSTSPLQSASVSPTGVLLLVNVKNSLRDLVYSRYLSKRLQALKCSTVGSFMKRDKTFVIHMISGILGKIMNLLDK